jgi:hypothetical protein
MRAMGAQPRRMCAGRDPLHSARCRHMLRRASSSLLAQHRDATALTVRALLPWTGTVAVLAHQILPRRIEWMPNVHGTSTAGVPPLLIHPKCRHITIPSTASHMAAHSSLLFPLVWRSKCARWAAACERLRGANHGSWCRGKRTRLFDKVSILQRSRSRFVLRSSISAPFVALRRSNSARSRDS